ncbi:hypothetical protein [Piscirickettsia salmonis]|nr:hypothetical protein [Piscirickettsia salmonis]
MLGDFASLDVQNTYRGSDAYEWHYLKERMNIFYCYFSSFF